ncbi:MAG: hypothetical protein WCT77_11650 [Bacteroidota bacterium]
MQTKTYAKAHKSTKAAKSHTKKIEKLGGKVNVAKIKDKTYLSYSFKDK